MIREVNIQDAAAIAKIYNHYVEHTIITFDESPLPVSYFEESIRNTSTEQPWYVYVEDDIVLGYAYASDWKSRCAYKHTAESTIYLDPNHLGKGIGSRLYSRLLESLKSHNYHAVIAGIALPNEGSIAIHERYAYEKVAHFKEVGRKFDKWIDVGYWELIL